MRHGMQGTLIKLLDSVTITDISRYLFEVGEHRESKQLLRTAFQVCGDEESLLYAHLRNTAGVVDFELNHLPRCRESLEKALEVRRRLLDPYHEELANTIHNMGNLSSAEGDTEKALRYFEEAEDIRSRLGEDSAIPLAITNQGMGRALFLQHKYQEALERYEKAELLAEQYAGKNSLALAGYSKAYIFHSDLPLTPTASITLSET